MANNMNIPHNMKDSRWLQLEVCREAQRSKCTRSDEECKFAHPPAHVEIQNGRVTACYDSIKGRCSRDNPPCKYYHPPQHLKDQLLVNGRNHLAMKNILVQQMQMQAVTLPPQLQLQPATQMQSLMNSYYTQAAAANAFNAGNPYLNAAQLYTTSSSPGPSGSGMSGLGESSSSSSPMASYASAGMFQQQHGGAMSSGGGGGGGGGSNNNKSRMDRLEVCREFARRNCRRSETDCRYAHPSEHVQVTDNMVVVCMDSLKGKCGRETCRYFHPPAHLVQQLKSRQSVNAPASSDTVGSSNGTVLLGNNGGATSASLFAPSPTASANAAANNDYGAALMAQAAAASSPFLAAAALLQQKQTIAMLMAAAQAQQQQQQAMAAAPSMYVQASGVHQPSNATAAAALASMLPSLNWPLSVTSAAAGATNTAAAAAGLKRKASYDQDADLVFHGLAPSVKRQTMSPSPLSGSSLAFLQQQQHHQQQQQQQQQALQAMYGLGPLLSSFQHSLSMQQQHPQFMTSLQQMTGGSQQLHIGGHHYGLPQHQQQHQQQHHHRVVVDTDGAQQQSDGGGARDSDNTNDPHPSTSS